MDADAIRELAIRLSSDDIAVSREATRRLQQLLTPSQIVAMLQSEAMADALRTLLGEMEAVGNVDVFRLIGQVVADTFAQPSHDAEAALLAPSAQFLMEFVVRSAAAADTAVAASVLAALHRVVVVVDGSAEAAAFLGRCLDAHFHDEHVLRLFDCDAVEAAANATMCRLLQQWTSLLPFMFDATQAAFESDPLLLANYLVASGVACRTVPVPPALRQRTTEVLRANEDALYTAFVCRFWSVALLSHEANGERDAAACVAAVLPAVESSVRDEATTEAVLDLLGSAASTQAGWAAVTAHLPRSTLQARLTSTSSSLRLATLNFLRSLLTSPHADASYFTKELLLDAWQTRTAPDDEVRLALWQTVNAALQHTSLVEVLGAVCASFLSSGAHEENVAVRSLRLRAAEHLAGLPTLPDSVKARLTQVVKRGLYPAGSTGVSLMTKD
ncbi:hypothetical protein NESM_000614700 [Novymonas esmeraldas]|uniref:Uncharacterized protein n=1 Tax=Novymonas esmeraldas TaxID=1808958 RepID=A0AAW0ESM4_9TRYP